MNWQLKSFEDLSNKELYQILQLRAEVFVVEQNCPYQDVDGKDAQATHLWATDANGTLMAYCRLLPSGVSYAEPSIGRVANALVARGKGLGREMMERAILHISQKWAEPAIRISAQCYLEKFYTSLGFATTSEPYLEDDIPHINMLWQKES
ncbi:MAG: GNAT family N-acetyltransferase [Chitinophagaceae bacterium]|nr:MAG: GNAT family N-acetyltransferase [Chitinophagaceae bacterium]